MSDAWPTTNLSLLLKCKDPRSDLAWEDFVARYRPSMLELIRSVFRVQDAEAEDIAQNVLLKLVVVMQDFTYDPDKKFRAWLRTVTRNAVRDALRSKQVRADQGSGDTRVKLMLDSQPHIVDDLAESVTSQIHTDVIFDAERLVQERVEPRTWQAYIATRDGASARAASGTTGMSIAAVYKAKSKVIRMIREEVSMLLAPTK
ncbi:MAG: sigma-70 family RNA polymerase sigma factor [Planctomycetales bacterium]|nr:sigma-70 family RNA polymerase sigma factor [Planctomycetales bacterium]